MAVTKVLNTTSFTIEVENGIDKTGAKTYSKNFTTHKYQIAHQLCSFLLLFLHMV